MSIAPVELDDAELVLAVARGDRSAFGEIYDRYADRLFDFCTGMLRDRDAAADCVQDVFVTAAGKLGQLEDPARLRGWLYAIARHEALARIRARRRETPSEELPEAVSAEPDLATLAARNELAELISEAFGGLSDRDRVVYELAYRHGLDGVELARALGVSHTNANTMVGRLRSGMERSLGALLVCRSVRADPSACPELAELLVNWDGVFSPLMRKRVTRHIEECDVCDAERRRRVSPVALLGTVPVFVPAPVWLRENTLRAAEPALPAAGGSTTPKRIARAGLGAALLLLGIGGVVQLNVPTTEEIEPVSESVETSGSRRVTVSETSAPSVTGGVTAQQVPTTAVTTSAPAPSPSTVVTPSLTSAPERTSAVATTTADNSFEPSRQSSTRTRTQTTTAARTSSATMTATYLPGTPQQPDPTTTMPPSDPIE